MAAPVVVCAHGLTGTRVGSCYRFVSLARGLLEQNIACLRFDFRGCGESEGRFQDVTSASLLEDLMAAIAAIDHLPGCDPTRIGIAASSYGAFTTALSVESISALRCAVLWAPVSNPRAVIDRDMTEPAWKFLREHGWIEHFGLRMGKDFIDTLPKVDAPALLAEARKPLLIFHAEGDQHIPIAQGRAYEQAAKDRGVETQFEELPVKDHGMRNVSANDRIITGSVAWLRRFLHPETKSESK